MSKSSASKLYLKRQIICLEYLNCFYMKIGAMSRNTTAQVSEGGRAAPEPSSEGAGRP